VDEGVPLGNAAAGAGAGGAAGTARGAGVGAEGTLAEVGGVLLQADVSTIATAEHQARTRGTWKGSAAVIAGVLVRSVHHRIARV
jgi:hypothetical protein